MKLAVIGAGMMGSAAAYDMARSPGVEQVTLADADQRRARNEAARLNRLAGGDKIRAERIDASSERAAYKLLRGHDGALSAVPYFFNLGLARAAVKAGCHFADLGGNNTVVRKTLELARKAQKRGVALAPDCGLSPGMASILAGELMRRLAATQPARRMRLLRRDFVADALRIYVGGLPEDPKPPFNYQLVFSVEGLINEYVEPANVLKGGKRKLIEPLSEPEEFRISGFPPLVAFHTSGGTSTMPENFAGQVGECFEKTLRYPGHLEMIRSLYDLGLFSSEKMKIGKAEVAPREITSRLFVEKFSGNAPDVVILRVEAERQGRVLSFTLVDRQERKTGMTAMMRTTAWPASIVLQMLVNGAIEKRGGIYQELDVPASGFIEQMAQRGLDIEYAEQFAGAA